LSILGHETHQWHDLEVLMQEIELCGEVLLRNVKAEVTESLNTVRHDVVIHQHNGSMPSKDSAKMWQAHDDARAFDNLLQPLIHVSRICSNRANSVPAMSFLFSATLSHEVAKHNFDTPPNRAELHRCAKMQYLRDKT